MNEKTTQRFVKELKNLQTVCMHPNIIEILWSNSSGSYKRSKKSDIFFGKFQMADRHFNRLKKIPYGIIFHASKGEREISIEGTPNSYIQLYKRCWNYVTSNFDEFISGTMPKISISDIQLSTDSNNGYEKFYLWITLWKLQPRLRGL
ncbi:hypothetical protein C2G38_2217862 [Gigaspora rosea]|uniref:Protein kinase domain-containing protein n=1 Tax=Gigaspora rosea TaxID=44941 RepID=A0A397U7E4_9GLOM|nr:hypothetical protein C2G38_2217862 [Gigaspora rosea]